MKSTSIHPYNAERDLGFFQKFLYLFLNWVNNLFPYHNLDKRIVFKSFGDLNWTREWDKTYPNSSVGRKLSDLFWRTMPWREIKKELGEIHIFDTGCGQGNYSTRIQDGSGGLVSSYTGVDAKRRNNWQILEERHQNFHFLESTSNDISHLIPPKTNLFISQSAIEHFDNDLLFFEQIRRYIEKSDRPIIQMHLFPGAAALPLYLFHGVRQYTPRTIAKITKLFDDSSNIYLYGLGGSKGKRVHWRYFTWPVLISRRLTKPTFNVSEYDKRLRLAVEQDMKHPSKSPIFWALVIHSHPRRKIW